MPESNDNNLPPLLTREQQNWCNSLVARARREERDRKKPETPLPADLVVHLHEQLTYAIRKISGVEREVDRLGRIRYELEQLRGLLKLPATPGESNESTN